METSEIISFDRTKYEELLKEISQLQAYFGSIMQRNVAASQLRIKYMFGMAPNEFQHFTTSFPEFVERAPLSMVYSYLGISPDEAVKIQEQNVQS